MRCNIRTVTGILRSVRALNDRYGSNESLSLLPLSLTSNVFFFLSIPNEMQNTIRELYYTERKGTYDPHGWDKLNPCLTDRYNAGVLDNPRLPRPRHLSHSSSRPIEWRIARSLPI